MKPNLLWLFFPIFILLFAIASCDNDVPAIDAPNNTDTLDMPMDTITIDSIINSIDTLVTDTMSNPLDSILADVTEVSFTGDEHNYIFSLSILSPDVDCDQYANWWEIISEDGNLIYRRILNHSHADEQPFIRSGGPVVISADETIIVRAWMHPTGYGGKSYKGSVNSGFEIFALPVDFADELGTQEPLPDFCLY